MGERIHKKTTPNGKVTTYLGRRDYVDHMTHTDPIDGVLLIDPEYIEDKKVFVKLVCAFRYGTEDLDVIGLQFRKDFCSIVTQVYPPLPEQLLVSKTPMQEKIIAKLKENAYPFFIEIPKDTPCSVSLQPGNGEKGKPCGIDYQLITYVAEDDDDKEKVHKQSSVQWAIRKMQFAPDTQGPKPTAEVQKEFLLSNKPLLMKASLDKELYYHGETINVTVEITNNSSKTVKNICVDVMQMADICLFVNNQYLCSVAGADEGDQVDAGSSFNKVFQLTPLLSNNKEKRGLALDGKLKQEDTNLASSTIVKAGIDKEALGIVVQYQVRIRLVMCLLNGEVKLDLPLQLMHPKPE